MSEELLPCPACSGQCDWKQMLGVYCNACLYQMDAGGRTETIEAHNTLARRAEIGRLVEVVLEDASALSVYRDGDEVTVRVVRPSGVTRAGITYADGSLFGAFRGLAAKMEAK